MIKLVNIAKILFRISILLAFLAFSFSAGRFLHGLEIFSVPHAFFEISLNIVNLSAPLVLPIATLLFVIGLIKYIIFKCSKEINQQKLSEIKKTLFYAGISVCLIIIAWATFNCIDFFYFPKWAVPPIP